MSRFRYLLPFFVQKAKALGNISKLSDPFLVTYVITAFEP